MEKKKKGSTVKKTSTVKAKTKTSSKPKTTVKSEPKKVVKTEPKKVVKAKPKIKEEVKTTKTVKKRKKAFTLIEILAVIVILGIIAMIAVPIVSNYISDSRKHTFLAHETNMKEAARSMVVECINGNETCDLPGENQYKEIYLNELIDKGFSQKLQNPQGEGYCNSSLSYVRIHNTGNSNYDFEACLYCGSYVTESENCSKIDNTSDKTPPVCGTVEGESSEWVNNTRTITVECSDTGSGCIRNKFSRTFKQSTIESTIEISDKAGNMTSCPVSVKLDRTVPTCELEVVGGTPENNGWVSGNIKVKIKSKTDGQSGLLTYGIGTSMNPNYNRETEIDLTDVNGLVTVFGYVKDNAGNEGRCSKNLRTGIERPDFDIYYGYQIFPLKDDYSASGLTVNTNSVTTTSNTPTLKFDNMNKYSSAKKVVIITSSQINNPSAYKLSVDNGNSYIEAYKKANSDGKTRLEFDIDKGTYNSYTFIFGNEDNKTIAIDRIEIQNTNNRLKSNKLVTVNLHPVIAKERVKTTGYSFDNGGTFPEYYYKSFDTVDRDISGVAQTKNDVPMVSDKKQYSIVKGDGDPSDISISANPPSAWTKGDVVLTGTGKDTDSGIIAYGFSTGNHLQYYSNGWTTIDNTKNPITYTDTVTKNGDYYFNIKDEAGNISNAYKKVTNIDKIPPTCSVEENSTIKCTDISTTEYGASSINGFIYGKNASSTGTFTSVGETNSLTQNITVTDTGTWNLYARDVAGNISNVASYDYYKVTYDKNNASSCTKTSEILRDCRAVDLAPTCTRTGYTFKGWSLDGSKVTSYNITGSDITLVAIWDANAYTIAFNGNGANGGSTGNASCTYDVNCTLTSNGFTKTGYSFAGWATSANGSVVYANGDTVNNLATSGTYTLYAKWNVNSYTVTFNGNGCGSPNPTSKTVTYDSTYGSLASISQTGYRFDGWYTAASGGSAVSESTTVNTASNHTLYAHCTNLCTSKTQSCTTAWNGWGGCSASCGGGTQSRTGTQTCKDGYGTGYVCSTTAVTGSQACNTQGCCSSTYVTGYGGWGGCSASCGGGTQSRAVYRKSNYNNQDCPATSESQSCNNQGCCTSTYVSGYGGWSGCSASCGGGTQSRAVYYASNYNGQSCGSSSQSTSCNTQSCCSPTGGGTRCGSGWAGHDCGTGAHWVSDGYYWSSSKPSCCSSGCTTRVKNGKTQYKIYKYACQCD